MPLGEGGGVDDRTVPEVSSCSSSPWTGEEVVRDPTRVAPFLRAFETLRAASLTGPDAVALIQRVAAELSN